MGEKGESVKGNCDNCRFYLAICKRGTDIKSDIGECRRHPPKRYDSGNSVFPIVLDDCWCGEYEKIM